MTAPLFGSRAIAAACLLCLALTACGSNDDSSASASPQPGSPVQSAPTAGNTCLPSSQSGLHCAP